MGIHSIHYWISVAVSLYAAYMVCFCMYKVDNESKTITKERFRFPRIVYLLVFISSFVPILNWVFVFVVFVMAIAAYYIKEDFYIETWLFDAPKEGEKKDVASAE